MKELGAECMTGGGNEFYRRIGYNRKSFTYGWKKQGLQVMTEMV